MTEGTAGGVTVLGTAASRTIARKCFLCEREFVMSCEDFLFGGCGERLRNADEPWEDWLCPDCAAKVRAVEGNSH